MTVKAHRGRVVRKMAADSLAELVTMAVRLRLARAGDPDSAIQLTAYEPAGLAIGRVIQLAVAV